MKHIKFLILGVFFILFNQSIQAEQLQYKAIDALNYYQSVWCAGAVQDRIYLRRESVIMTDSGLFLIAGHESIPLSRLHFDESGFYIKPLESWNIFNTWTCANCGYINSNDWNTCSNCQKYRGY